MEFQIEKNSAVPVIKQIQEQIKLSIAMGMLKRGDILPSIREVEKQTGVNRGQIHRAFLALQRSGLLAPAPGKRTAIAISAAAPDAVNIKCRELTEDIIKRVRSIGVSPIAFARYFGRNVQEEERRSPFLAYVDSDKERALRRAEQISKLWHASVIGLTTSEFKRAVTHGSTLRKALVNHLTLDLLRPVHRGRKIDIIPIEISYTAQTIRMLGKIREASILVLLPKHAVPSAGFIMEQLQKWIKCKDASVCWKSVNKPADFKPLLSDPQYDCILVSPGAWGVMPDEWRKHSSILQLQMDFAPEALEIARIRAGVIV